LAATAANLVSPQALDIRESELLSLRQLDRIAHQIQQTTLELEAFLRSRNQADLTTRLKPESWSVAECLDHLTQTTRTFLPAIANAMGEAPRVKKDRRLRTGLFPSLFLRTLTPPYRIRFKVLPQLAPQTLNSEEAWTNFVGSQAELLANLKLAAGLAIDKVNIKSPVYARINYNIYGVFRMLAAHQSRHVWQIRQILATIDDRRVPISSAPSA
jgi:DinB superfamily